MPPPHVEVLNELLHRTLYVFNSEDRPELVRRASRELRQLARRVAAFHESAHAVAEEARGQLQMLQQARLMVESSRIEGIDLDFGAALAALDELAGGTRHVADALSRAIVSDEKIRDAMGLAKAHQLGRQLVESLDRPLSEVDLRGLHQQICEGEPFAGRLRHGDIKIGGAAHLPPPEAEMREQLPRLLEWFDSTSEGDPVVVASAAHTWLAHLHPFPDGNGRLARLLGNLALSRRQWPPVVIRSGPAKYEYYQALAESDEGGELLPVVRIFLEETRRSLSEWESPDDAINSIEAELYKNHDYDVWCALAVTFGDRLRTALESDGINVESVGFLEKTDFEFLKRRNRSGNGWFLRVYSRGSMTAVPVDFLFWFGYQSDAFLHAGATNPGTTTYRWPSIFFSERNRDPDAFHRYRPLRDVSDFPMQELVLRPRLGSPPAVVRRGNQLTVLSLDAAVEATRRAVLVAADEQRRVAIHRRELGSILRSDL